MVVPSVAQQLAAIRHTIAKTIIPALAADADFEREQAGLVLASLDWAIDVVDSEHRYEIVEHADHRALLESLLAADPDGGTAEARAVLDAAAAPPDDLPALREQARALKRAAEAAFVSLRGRDGAAPEAAETAHTLMARAARRQTERELAWARMTGFPKDAPAVADVLADQVRAVAGYSFADSIHVGATPQEVYDAVSDITRTGEWSPQCVGCEWHDGDGPRVGARFTGHNRRPGREWSTTGEIVAAEPGRAFAWEINGRGLVRWGYEMEPDGDGTRLTETWHLSAAGLDALQELFGDDAEREIAVRVDDARSGIPVTLAAVKRVVEARS